MNDSEFFVPSRLDDLFESTSNKYSIHELVSKRSVTVEVLKFKRSVYDDYDDFILKNFDVYCSMLKQFGEFDEDLKMTAFKALLQVSEKLSNSLPLVLEVDAEDLVEETRNKYRNLVKMMVYLMCQFASFIETDIYKATIASGVVKAKGKKKSAAAAQNPLWSENRLKFIVLVKRLFQLPIKNFWIPPVIDHELINFATTSFFKLLENTDVARDKSIKPQIFSFLGTSLMEFNTGLGYCVKIIQLVQDFEHLPNVMAQAVAYFVTECSCDPLIADLFREVTRIDVKILTQNLTAAHSLSQFLISLCEECPEKTLAAISSLLQFLELESHVMRNCVLTVSGNLIITLLSSSDLSKKEKQAKDELLCYIEDHILDVNSFVRSRALQVMKLLLEKRSLSSEQYCRLGTVIAKRIRDKASNVRKNAIAFMSAFIEVNQFACQIPIEVLRESVDKENEKLLKRWPNAYILDDSDSEQETTPAKGVVFDDSDEESSSADNKTRKKKSSHSSKESMLTNSNVSNKEATLSSSDVTNKETTVSKGSVSGTCVTSVNGEVSNNEATPAVNASKELEDGEAVSKEVENGEAVSKEVENDDVANEDSQEALIKQKVLVAYLKNTLQFAEVISNAVVPIRNLLKSSTQTDVLEAIDFFVATLSIGLKESFAGIKDVFCLVWAKEPTVREASIGAFRALYLVDGTSTKTDAILISNNLLLMMKDTTTEDASNIQEFIKHFVNSNEIPDSVINILLKNYLKPPPLLTEQDRFLSLCLFSMAAEVRPEIVVKNIAGLVHVGLGPDGESSFLLARETLNILSKANKPNRDKMKSFIESEAEEFRLPSQSELGKRIKFFLLECIANFEDDQWISMANKAIETIFTLIQSPVMFVAQISVELCKQIHRQCMKGSAVDPGDTTESIITCSMLLARFMAFCGNVALHYLMYMEMDYFAYLRKQEAKREKRRRKSTAKTLDTPLTDSTRKKRKSIQFQQEYQLMPPADEDATADFIDSLIAKNIKNDKKLVGVLLPIVIETCKMSLKNPNKEISINASTALTKFMLLSEQVCEENMQLVATLMEKSSEATVRCNLVIAMGDLTTKFPNVTEPWTSKIYERLKDTEMHVRKAAIIILAHLILHDYVRVKGWISEIARCIVDPDEDVSHVASYLFEELSKKGNVIYNIIPDIISSLSDPNSGFPEESFQAVLKHVLQYVEKDKLVEGLVEKLCIRFTDSSTDLQIHELTFCLSLLKLTDKCFSKLMEFKSFLKEKLSDPIVLKYISNLAANAKKNDAKTAAEIDAFRKELGI